MVGRVKDLIIRGGENISPKEIEEVFGQNELVRDVQVVGTHCDKFQEDVTAWVIPQHFNQSAS
jgi:fatty-acyl-CoA synthase